jgi:hypothetical protein
LLFRSTVRPIFQKQKIMRDNKRQTIRRPEVRSLKIQAQTRLLRWSRKTVPEIKLSGEWLNNLGFLPEQRVTITTMNKLLIIRLDE